jgi:hypothetical protein
MFSGVNCYIAPYISIEHKMAHVHMIIMIYVLKDKLNILQTTK